ncbi:hypothetical protein ACYF6T_38475 [Streptomyces sp. 7R007]
MLNLRKKTIAAAGAVVLAATGAGLVTAGTAHAAGHGVDYYGVWATHVNVRKDVPEECSLYPSTTNCPVIVDTVSTPERVYVLCQQLGQTVGGNPYWVWVRTPRGNLGYMASYYTDNPTNKIDGVPIC